MFDIGFAELLIIGVVALFVIGPERLPEAIRTASIWLNRIRRGFNEIKQEVQQELHNDSVMQELRKAGEGLKKDTESIGSDLKDAAESLTPAQDSHTRVDKPDVDAVQKKTE
jgi:sec-independent protein translocase protein TatB